MLHINDNTTLILGPPGTGKTTWLMDKAKELIQSGTPSHRVAFVSFTKQAAREAVARVARFDDPRHYPHFSTLHAMAYRDLGVGKRGLFNWWHAHKLSTEIGFDVPGSGDADTLPARYHRGAMSLFLDGLARNTLTDVIDVWKKHAADDLTWSTCSFIIASYRKYLSVHNLHDFTSMIEDWVRSVSHVDYLDYLIVDEAQDLTPLQWQMVQRLGANVAECFVAGDDDQAIYTWSGADVETFLNIEHRAAKVLQQSHRLPRAVYNEAVDISDKILHRYKKPFQPRDAAGCVEWKRRMDEVDMGQGTWLVLARNRDILEQAADHCYHNGWAFSSKDGRSPLDEDAVRAIYWWEQLRAENKISGAELLNLIQYLPSKDVPAGREKIIRRNFVYHAQTAATNLGVSPYYWSKRWDDALEGIGFEDREYYRAVLKNGDKVLQPRIRISTIHAVKGAEADNVVLYTDMSPLSNRSFQADPDNEHRVFYVAVTRARERLIILDPWTELYYDI